MTIAEGRMSALQILKSAPIYSSLMYTSPELDISVILSHLLGVSRSFLLAHGENSLDSTEQPFFEAINSRSKGTPVAYITGIKEFWGLPFKVTPAVLIPKPDTEILVERAIEIIERLQKETSPESISVLDVCTGSGCIAISIKHTFPQIQMTATDISPPALEIARFNAQTNLVPHTPHCEESIRFYEQDLRNGLVDVHSGTYNLIVSNPPYVPSDLARELLCDGRNEPIVALDGGTDGLDLVRELITQAKKVLAHNGRILIETGEYNAKEAASYLNLKGFIDIVVHKDLEGQDRVIEGTLP